MRRLTPPPPPQKRGKGKKNKDGKKNERNIESGHLYFKAELLLVDILSFLNATCVLSFITGGKLLLQVAQKVSRFWD